MVEVLTNAINPTMLLFTNIETLSNILAFPNDGFTMLKYKEMSCP